MRRLIDPIELKRSIVVSNTGEIAKDTNVPSTDCISRQAAIDEIDEWIKAFRENGHKESAADACLIQDGIIQLPSAQPDLSSYSDKLWRNAYERGKAEAQPHRMPGRWIDRNGNIVSPFWERYECSECGARSDNTNYCPNCGAKMENGGENRMRWERTGREVKANGESTTTYTSHDPEGWTIESRKRNILHANGVGSWAHTEFFLIRPDGTETEHWTLRDAKAVAETLLPEPYKGGERDETD